MKPNPDSLIVVATCNELFEAEVLVAKLQSHGIEASIQNVNPFGYLQAPYAASVNEFKVLVLEVDAEAAKEIICNC